MSSLVVKKLRGALRHIYDIPAFIGYCKHRSWGSSIWLEACTLCQLKCPGCQRQLSKDIFEKNIGLGCLSFDNFKKIVDENPWVRHIELSNWGEIFLNPQLGEIIEYAYAKNVTLTAGNGANLNTLSDEMAERLVKYNFSQVTVSIDGASSDIYRIYRIGGDFDAVINNIKKINYYKQKYKKGLPSLLWQFIVFGHNEHQLPMARKMAKELNMEFSPKGNTSPPYSPIKDEDFVKREAGLASWSEKETMYQMDRFCAQLYYSPQVNWDGELLGCCVAIKGSFGNVFKAGLISCLKSKKYIYAKEMLLGRRPAIQGIPCSDCPVYLNSRHTLRDNRLFKTLRLVDIYFANKYIKNLDNISR